MHRRDLGRCIKIWGIVSFPSFLLLRCFPFAKVVTKAVGGLHRNSSGTYPCQKLCLNSLSSTYIYKEIADIWMTVSIKCQAQGKNWSLCKKKIKSITAINSGFKILFLVFGFLTLFKWGFSKKQKQKKRKKIQCINKEMFASFWHRFYIIPN